jgi:hypothetical protein
MKLTKTVLGTMLVVIQALLAVVIVGDHWADN